MSGQFNIGRQVCYTWNQPGMCLEEAIGVCAAWSAILDAEEQVDYAIHQLEKGESGTIHLQGFLHFKKPWRLSRVLELFKQVEDAGINYLTSKGKGPDNGLITNCSTQMN